MLCLLKSPSQALIIMTKIKGQNKPNKIELSHEMARGLTLFLTRANVKPIMCSQPIGVNNAKNQPTGISTITPAQS